MKKRIFLLTMATAAMIAGVAMNCYAAGWQHNGTGWWWQNDDATWPGASWQWLDGDGDGIAECYYFDANGYMLSNTTTPDGYMVDAQGRWILNGVVQTKVAGNTNNEGAGGGASGNGATNSTGENPYAGNRTVTGRYDLTSAGEVLHGAYDVPIDGTDVTAINDPQKFCELMNLGELETQENVNLYTNSWRVDNTKPIVNEGKSNIYYYYNSLAGSSKDYSGGMYKIVKVSKSRPIRGNRGDIYEVRAYGFEDGYLLVNTTRNGVYFNERGEAVINGKVVRHTNYCYYGDDHWDTTFAMKREFSWDDDPLTWDGYSILYHTQYMAGRNQDGDIRGHGFGDCCADIYDFHY